MARRTEPIGGEKTKQMHYTTAFKARMIKKMSRPNAISAHALSEEAGVSQGTLSRWLREAGTVMPMAKAKSKTGPMTAAKRPQDWTPGEKLQVVLEAAPVAEDELGRFLRAKGLHRALLDEWRMSVESGAREALGDGVRKKGRRSPEQKHIRDLERQLRRKEKALAEAAALLILQKKVNHYFGDEDEGDNTDLRNDES